MRMIMVASENDALRRGKVGGLADVVRDLPRALGDMGIDVDVITPAYGFLHRENPSDHHTTVDFPFFGKRQTAEVYQVTGKQPHDRVRYFALEHPDVRGNPIYYNDPASTPFMRDAEKFALFCSAVGQYLCRQMTPYVLHLHDWHTGLLFLLRELHPAFGGLKGVRTLYTIHNLGVQGTRPIEGKNSTLQRWFPELLQKKDVIKEWSDPRWEDPCINPMLAGIQHADKVNTVSPGYAEEILHPSDHANGYYGGEGLEHTLRERKNDAALSGILNGCEYPPAREYPRLGIDELLGSIHDELRANADTFRGVDGDHIAALRRFSPSFVLTGITRIVEQKVRLFLEKGSDGRSALEHIMYLLAEYNGACIIVGSGVSEFEEKFIELTKRNRRFLFLLGYSEKLSGTLYASGTLFLMPSSFEPCGISQMIAMREGQPCVVHAVGGLKDTVTDGVNGFTFDGRTIREQVDAFVGTVKKAVRMFRDDKPRWEEMRRAAQSARFTWGASARKYVELMGME